MDVIPYLYINTLYTQMSNWVKKLRSPRLESTSQMWLTSCDQAPSGGLSAFYFWKALLVVPQIEVSIVMRVSQHGWFIMENPTEMDDFWVPQFSDTQIFSISHPQVANMGWSSKLRFICLGVKNTKCDLAFPGHLKICKRKESKSPPGP